MKLRITIEHPDKTRTDHPEDLAPEELSHDPHAEVVQAWLAYLEGEHLTAELGRVCPGATLTMYDPRLSGLRRTFTIVEG